MVFIAIGRMVDALVFLLVSQTLNLCYGLY